MVEQAAQRTAGCTGSYVGMQGAHGNKSRQAEAGSGAEAGAGAGAETDGGKSRGANRRPESGAGACDCEAGLRWEIRNATCSSTGPSRCHAGIPVSAGGALARPLLGVGRAHCAALGRVRRESGQERQRKCSGPSSPHHSCGRSMRRRCSMRQMEEVAALGDGGRGAAKASWSVWEDTHAPKTAMMGFVRAEERTCG